MRDYKRKREGRERLMISHSLVWGYSRRRKGMGIFNKPSLSFLGSPKLEDRLVKKVLS